MELWKIDRLEQQPLHRFQPSSYSRHQRKPCWDGLDGVSLRLDSGDTSQDKAQIDAEAAAIALLAMAADLSQWIVTATLPNLMNEGLLHLATSFLKVEF